MNWRPIAFTALWLILVPASIVGFISGYYNYRDERSRFTEHLCPVTSCSVVGVSCYHDNGCFDITTTIIYPPLNYTFIRTVVTSWNCTAEYPNYRCYVSNDRILLPGDFKWFGAGWIVLQVFSVVGAIASVILFIVNIIQWSQWIHTWRTTRSGPYYQQP